MASADAISMHLAGKAVDFSILGVEPYKLVEDIVSGDIGIRFGVLYVVGDMVHITAPYKFSGWLVSGLVLDSPKRADWSLQLRHV